MQELKDTLIEQGQPFVWFTPAGWFFHEQPNSICRTREEVLSANSVEELMEAKPIEPEAVADTEQPIQEPAPKGRNKKK